MKDNGLEILVGLKATELKLEVQSGARKIDDLIPLQLVTLEQSVKLMGKIPLVKDSFEQAAYLSILATDGPGPRPETDWLWSPWETTKQQVKYDIALKFHETYQAKVAMTCRSVLFLSCQTSLVKLAPKLGNLHNWQAL